MATAHEQFAALPVQRRVAINAAILEAFKDPENGFLIEFRRATGSIGTPQETLDAIRMQLNETLPANAAITLSVKGKASDATWTQALGRQTEVMRGIITTMTGQESPERAYGPSHYAALASKAPGRPGGVTIPEGAPMPLLTNDYHGDILADLKTATAKVLAARCAPTAVSPTGDTATTLTYPDVRPVQGAACSRT